MDAQECHEGPHEPNPCMPRKKGEFGFEDLGETGLMQGDDNEDDEREIEEDGEDRKSVV